MSAARATSWWRVVAVRAAAAIVAGLVVTFSADHSSQFGLLVVGVFAVVTAAVLTWGARVVGSRDLSGLLLVQAAASGLAGIAALAANGAGFGMLIAVIVIWGTVTGVTDIVLWYRTRGRDAFARDWLTVGILTLVFVLAVLVVPGDFANAWEVENKDGSTLSGIVTAEVFVVGIFGAYAFMLGVYLLIAAVSARGVKQLDHKHNEPHPGAVEPAAVSGEKK